MKQKRQKSINYRLNRVLLVSFASILLLSATIDLNNLFNYSGQAVPGYIIQDNGMFNQQDNRRATLGRVLFYDKALSLNNTVACATCHQQEFAFSDTAKVSIGFDGGLTDRHSMRLVNSRFGISPNFFWDKRANTLEEQTTQPIQNAVEMGFSGSNGQPDIDSLIRKLSATAHYPKLFSFVYGDSLITEDRIQLSIANFVRSIQSFDSKYDVGLAQTGNVNQPFSNFTEQENRGKALFMGPVGQGGASCISCHRAPEFDIAPNILNNGVITVANDPSAQDLTNHRSPSLRDVFNGNGVLNGPLMHDGSFTSMLAVVNHYNAIEINPQLDSHLFGPGQSGQNLNLTEQQKLAIVVFMKTLSGTNIYTNPAYSDPFDSNGAIDFVYSTAGIVSQNSSQIEVYPIPSSDYVTISSAEKVNLTIFNLSGKKMHSANSQGKLKLNIQDWPSGIYFVRMTFEDGRVAQRKIIKE